MKTKKILVFMILAFSACTKKDSDAIRSEVINNSVADSTDTVKVPITDLGTGTYLGFTGGLYPGGINNPPGQYKKDLKNFATNIRPLNDSGLVDSSRAGKIAFISLGGSTSGKMMRNLKQFAKHDSTTNRFLKLINCSDGEGNASFESIGDPDDPYWGYVFNEIMTSKAFPDQVQIIYVESEDSSQVASFPERPYIVKNDIEAAMRTCKMKFKNLKLVYFLGRTTTFPGHGILHITNMEPCVYYNGWACKFAIEDQINGVPGTEYKGDSAVAPLLTWGWYEWADGTDVPRQDGFTWQDSDTKDGIHATASGQDTLTSRFHNFLLTDKYASIWYTKH